MSKQVNMKYLFITAAIKGHESVVFRG